MGNSASKVTKHDVIILGCGGHGRELASYLRETDVKSGCIRWLGFIDEDPGKRGLSFCGGKVLGDFKALGHFLKNRLKPLFYLTATGDNKTRARFVEQAKKYGGVKLKPWIWIHPKVLVAGPAKIGEGTVVFPGTVLTTDIKIGKHCILNAQVSVSHDAVIGDFTNVNPGVRVCGNVTVGPSCYLGAGSTLIDKIAIGAGTVIGAGTTVIKNLPANVTAVGVPARIIKRR